MRVTALFLAAASGLIASSLLAAPAAKAEDFSFTATTDFGITFSGTLSGSMDPAGDGAFDITNATGSVFGSNFSIPMTLVTPSGSVGNPQTFTASQGDQFTYDNVVFNSGNSLDAYGLLFADGGDDTELGFNGTNYFFANTGTGPGAGNGVALTSFTLTDTTPTSVTPEPSSFLLLGSGLLGIAGVVRKRLA